MINHITDDFDNSEKNLDAPLEVEYIEESFPTFINEEQGINIPGIKYPTLKMRFNFERGYVETISGIVVIEVNDEGQELSHKTLILDEENKYRTDNDYFYLYKEDGTNWGARIGYDANIGYQFDFTNNDKVRVYFPDYYDYDDVANTWTLKDGASLEYLPIETTRNEELQLAKLKEDAATNDILGWSLCKESGNYFAEKINVYKDISLYAFDGDLELIEQPTYDNNYTVKTNKSELCEDYLTYNWYKVELDEDFTYTRCENDAEYNASGSEPRIYFKAKRDENKVSNIYNYDGRKVLDLSQKNLPANTVITYTFNNDIDLSSKYVEKYLDDYVYDRTNKTITVRKNPDTRYPSFYICSNEDLSGTYKVEVEKEERKLVNCHTSNLVAAEDGYYLCEVYGKDNTKKLYTTHVFYEAPKISSVSSKKYNATDLKDTTEKISGSGKKGSTRTITPQEGRKVSSVIVTDKNGNEIDVTLNDDGTYSFIQPASNVDVVVNYKNREITLNIGSTVADVDGEKSNLDVCPVIRNDRTMLPIRFVVENLGAKVDWSEKNPNYVAITRGDTKIEITLGSDTMKVNGNDVKLDSVAFAENDRTYLPVRAISEALNAIVEWNEEKPNEVKIFERQ